MHFIDKTLLAFSDPATAAVPFSDEALKAVISASYGLPVAGLIGSPVPRFDRLDFAPFTGQTATEIAAKHHAISRGDDPGLNASGLNPRIDVLLTGTITVSAAFPRAEIGVERLAVPDLSGIDAAIPAPAPADPSALEVARRAVLITRLQAEAQNAEAVTEAMVDSWLAQAGFTSVGEFLSSAAAASVPMRQFVLSFNPLPGTAAPATASFPVAAAALIRDVTAPEFRLADLLQASRAAQTRLELEGVAPKLGGEALPPGRAAIIWIVAAEWFDDSDWPGGISGNAEARRAARITKATDWLTTQGIALIPVT